eukprot:9371315-Karenia_brevis.AAC.1
MARFTHHRMPLMVFLPRSTLGVRAEYAPSTRETDDGSGGGGGGDDDDANDAGTPEPTPTT